MAGLFSHLNLGLAPSTLRSLLLTVVCVLPGSAFAITSGHVECVQGGVQSDAEKLFAEGDELFKLGTRESLYAALIKYRDAAEKWHLTNEQQRESEALSRIAASYYGLDEYAEALRYYTQSLDLCRTLGDRSGEAQALNGIGRSHWSMGDMTKALDFYTQSLEPRRAAGKRIGEAYTLGNIGIIYLTIGEGKKALDLYRQALSIMEDNQSLDGQAFITYNTALAYASRSENSKALELYQEALRLQRKAGDRGAEASTLNNMGLVYAGLGEEQKALNYYDQALAIRQTGGYRSGTSISLRNIGDVFARSGQTEKALNNYLRALEVSEAVGDRRAQAYTLDSIGVVYWKKGDYETARSYFDKAIALFEKIEHKTGRATTLANIASTYAALGQVQDARKNYQDALSLFREVEDLPGEIRTLYEIALIERNGGGLMNARALIGEALDFAESVRSAVATQELRASYFATVQDYYDLEIDILMQLHRQEPLKGFDALALQTSERARARSLLDLLTKSRIDIHEGADPLLIQEEHRLQQELDEKTRSRTQLLSDRHDAQSIITIEKDLKVRADQYEEVQLKLKRSSSHYAALTQTHTLGLKDIQEQLPDSNTLLLEYALGNDRSFLWAITRSSIHSFELPNRAELERLAHELSESVRARNLRPTNETAEQRAKRLTFADAQYVRLARTLSQTLLEPVLSELGNKRLMVVAEGALQNVPFAALPIPAARKPKTNVAEPEKPLVVDHEIVSLPSASILPVLGHEAASQKKGAKNLIIFADPVFASNDPRIQSLSSRSQQESSFSNSAAHPTFSDPSAEDFPRLIFSRDEAQSVLSLVGLDDSRVALDFEASLILAKSPDLKDYNVVHFATHTRIDTDRPERSEIILSRYDKSGKSVDSSLSLADIYNLNISAQLVVLSGCETALGKELRGEGMMGLTRGFMYAGAPRVVATLWRIDDRVTSELMKVFYEGMFQRGLSPAAALREAQVAVWRKQNWAHPYYWAAFVIQGVPNKMD